MTNNSLYAPIYDDSVTMVNVQFTTGKGGLYTYKTNFPLEVGDVVVVQTGASYGIAKVVEVDVEIPIDNDYIEYKWVVVDVPLGGFEKQLEREQALIKEVNRKRVRNMRQAMIEHIGVAPNQLTTLAWEDNDDVEESASEQAEEDQAVDNTPEADDAKQ